MTRTLPDLSPALGRIYMPTAERIRNLEPGSPDWLRVMSASKVPAMLGISPYQSPYSLWHIMAGNIPPQPATDVTERGHYLEPSLLHWWDDQHPEILRAPGGAFRHRDRHWQTATPDGIGYTVRGGAQVLVECKTAINDWEWGTPGTDEIPPYTRAQVQYQLDVTGLSRCYVAMLTTRFQFREYVVDYDAEDATWIREQAVAWLDSLAKGIEPDVDNTDHTYQAIRQLHPLIDGSQVELDPEEAVQFLHAYRQTKAAERTFAEARNRVAKAMGTASTAKFGDVVYAARQSRSGGTPFVVVARGLIDKEEIAS